MELESTLVCNTILVIFSKRAENYKLNMPNFIISLIGSGQYEKNVFLILSPCLHSGSQILFHKNCIQVKVFKEIFMFISNSIQHFKTPELNITKYLNNKYIAFYYEQFFF